MDRLIRWTMLFGMDNSSPLKKAAEALPEVPWSSLNENPSTKTELVKSGKETNHTRKLGS